MEIHPIIQMLIAFIGGLGLFLIGMKLMSEGMQAVAGEKIRKLIGLVTDNRLLGCGVGAAVTSLIQSSSVTTVMIVGMVNAGLMSLRQAVGVILGADIGTTITAWLVALNVVEYGLPLLGVSALFYLFSNNERVRYISMMFLGLGMVFFGLDLMQGGFSPFRDNVEFISLFSKFNPDNYGGILKCIFVGSILTAIIQSSSATVAITITLANTGVIGFEMAVALVLGQNIGTTITAYLASLNTSIEAKRTAYTHIIIKVIGVALMVPFFYKYIGLLKWILPGDTQIAAKIAFAHTGFNVLIVSFFLPLIDPLIKFVCLLSPHKLSKERHHLTYLDLRIYDIPALSIQQSFDEIIKMGKIIQDMFMWLRESITDNNQNTERNNKIFHAEKILDLMQKEIVEFISKVLAGTLTHNVTEETRGQLRIADEYESISDYVMGILKLDCKMKNNNLHVPEQGKKELLELHDNVERYFSMISEAVANKNEEIFSNAQVRGETITKFIKTVRYNHIERFECQKTSPLVSLVFTDMLSAYRRIKDHSFNVAEVLAGEK